MGQSQGKFHGRALTDEQALAKSMRGGLCFLGGGGVVVVVMTWAKSQRR